MQLSIPSLCILLALLPSWALAQFGFFDQMFQGQQHGRQQQQQQASGAAQYHEKMNSVSCNRYLCPGTLDCVNLPVMCPCPNQEDIKCIIPELTASGKPDPGGAATVVCVSGKQGCGAVQDLL